MFEIFTEGMIFFEEKIFEHRQLDKITMIDKTDEYDISPTYFSMTIFF